MAKQQFDSFLNEYYEEIQKTIEEFKDKHVDYNDLIEKVKQNIKDKQYKSNQKKKGWPYSEEEQVKPLKKDIINNINDQKIKTMNFGQSNLKEATKYSQYYGYKVKVASHKNYDKSNYVFMLENSFFKKLFSKIDDRFTYKQDILSYHTVVFKYNPKSSRKMMDDGTVVNFSPFEIPVSTEGCYDFVYYHTPNNGLGKEVLKCLYVLNMKKLEDKLKDILADTFISDKGKVNMVASLHKHLGNVQTPGRYGVEDMEEICGMEESEAIMIIDDYEDGELLNSLGEYIT